MLSAWFLSEPGFFYFLAEHDLVVYFLLTFRTYCFFVVLIRIYGYLVSLAHNLVV